MRLYFNRNNIQQRFLKRPSTFLYFIIARFERFEYSRRAEN